jgi:hypothetical protein
MTFRSFWKSIPTKQKSKTFQISKRTSCIVYKDTEKLYILGVKQKAGAVPLTMKKTKAEEHFKSLQQTTHIAGAYFTGLYWSSKIGK